MCIKIHVVAVLKRWKIATIPFYIHVQLIVPCYFKIFKRILYLSKRWSVFLTKMKLHRLTCLINNQGDFVLVIYCLSLWTSNDSIILSCRLLVSNISIYMDDNLIMKFIFLWIINETVSSTDPLFAHFIPWGVVHRPKLISYIFIS